MIEGKDTLDIKHELKIALGWDASELANYRYHNVNGTKTKVFTKYFTGTSAAAATTNVAHGLTDHTKILQATLTIEFNSTGTYFVYDFEKAATADTFHLAYDATNLIIGAVGANFQGQPYNIKMEYYL
jgi:hypothetical protein